MGLAPTFPASRRPRYRRALGRGWSPSETGRPVVWPDKLSFRIFCFRPEAAEPFSSPPHSRQPAVGDHPRFSVPGPWEPGMATTRSALKTRKSGRSFSGGLSYCGIPARFAAGGEPTKAPHPPYLIRCSLAGAADGALYHKREVPTSPHFHLLESTRVNGTPTALLVYRPARGPSRYAI